MSPWILLGVIVAGALFLIGMGLYITHDYDDQGEPLEYWHE
ncbi:hypothetical protein ACN06F_09170 [Vreelandella sp. 21]